MLGRNDVTPPLPFYLGCPVWNCAGWGGQVYPEKSKKSDWLHWYTRTFNTVEGNSTFYGLPSLAVAKRWASESAKGFRFALKVPREISHVLRLHRAKEALARFCKVLKVLGVGHVLGPSFLQLPPDYGPENYVFLERFIRSLPREFPWAVEVRHHDWFDRSDNENRLDGLLCGLNIDKVIFDSRALFQTPADDECERVSQSRKPKTPHRVTVTGRNPMLRIVGRNRIEMADPWFEEWADQIVDWIATGLEPYVFTHAPDDQYAPSLARMFFEKIRKRIPDVGLIPTPPKPDRQPFLF